MALDQKKAVKIRLRAILRSIQNHPDHRKNNVSRGMAEAYNGLLDEAATVVPEKKQFLPPKIKLGGHFDMLGLAEASHFDLET